jgi:predicted metal-dependent hydrolase
MAARHALADLDPATREALAKGIAEFNSWRFYDCHETLEDVWREVGSKGEEGTLADFYQGIIKVAAGFHHVLRDSHHGAVALLSDAFRLLEPFRPQTLGVDVDRLVEDVRPCLDRIVELGPERLREFDRAMIPRIELEQGTENKERGKTQT